MLSKNRNVFKNPDRNSDLVSIRLKSISGSHTRFGHKTTVDTLKVTLGMKGISSKYEGQSHIRLALMADFDFYLTCRIYLKSGPTRSIRDLKFRIEYGLYYISYSIHSQSTMGVIHKSL